MLTHEKLKALLFSDREKAFEQLYIQAFPAVARYVSRMGGSFQDAKDVFQDAVIILYEKMVSEHLTLQHTPQAYYWVLPNICGTGDFVQVKERYAWML